MSKKDANGLPKGLIYSRRQIMKAGLIAGGSALVSSCGLPLGSDSNESHSGGGGGGAAGFSNPLRFPPVAVPDSSDETTDYYTVTMQPGTVQVLSGAPTTIWGFNGQWPGPTFKVRSGRNIQVRQINNLPERMSTHLHGANTPPSSDGHPAAYFQPGEYRDYIYPNAMPQAPLWYHDHAVDQTGFHVMMGLAGFYLLSDDLEDSLNLPSGNHHVPMVLQDRKFDANNQIVYTLDSSTIKEGFTGDTLCVNGTVGPYLEVSNVKYRFTLLNGSNARTYNLSLDTGDPLVVIASDGGFLPAPVEVGTLEVASAERFEFIIDFSNYPVGSSVVLRDSDGWSGIGDVIRFDIVASETDQSSLPSILRPITRYNEADATVCRRFQLDKDHDDNWVINGLGWDAARIDAKPELDSFEIWEFENNSREMHPMHVHLVQYQILDIDGQPPPAHEAGWKDVVKVPSRGNVRIMAKFEFHEGPYVFHCHKLEHEDHHMMGQFEVVPVGSGDGDSCGSGGGGWNRST